MSTYDDMAKRAKQQDMKRRMICMLDRTWDAIGGDVLCAVGGEENEWGEPIGAEMTRDHVIEVVMDADHYVMYGNDREAAKAFKTLTYDEKIEIGKAAFTFDTYGC